MEDEGIRLQMSLTVQCIDFEDTEFSRKLGICKEMLGKWTLRMSSGLAYGELNALELHAVHEDHYAQHRATGQLHEPDNESPP